MVLSTSAAARAAQQQVQLPVGAAAYQHYYQPGLLPPAPQPPALNLVQKSVDSIDPTLTNSVGACTCKRSKCLKLYCVCFSAGVLCGGGCKCTSCENTLANAYGVVMAQQRAMARNRGAFKQKITTMAAATDVTTPSTATEALLAPQSTTTNDGSNVAGSSLAANTTTNTTAMLNNNKYNDEDNHSGAAGAGGGGALPPVLLVGSSTGSSSHPQQQHRVGCRCKNSRCLKRYCECFRSKIACSERCKCVNCANTNASMTSRPW